VIAFRVYSSIGLASIADYAGISRLPMYLGTYGRCTLRSVIRSVDQLFNKSLHLGVAPKVPTSLLSSTGMVFTPLGGAKKG